MKKILVPTDFSKGADNASNCAIKLASKFGAEIIFLHIMSIPFDWINVDLNQSKLYPDITKKVNKAQSQLNEWTEKAERQGITASSYLHYNEDHQHIVKHASDNTIDLIVMGFHGVDALSDLFLGSNTQRVVRIAEIPILVVNKPIEKIEKVALISNFQKESYAIRSWVSNFMKSTKAELHLVYINTRESFLDSITTYHRFEKFKKDLSCHASTYIHNDYAFENGINTFCDRNAIDLIIIPTHKRTGVDRLASGSLTENVIDNSNVPVLSIPLLVK